MNSRYEYITLFIFCLFALAVIGCATHTIEHDQDVEALYSPSWSPDGSKIAFSWWDEATETSTIYSINRDGSGRQEIFVPGRRSRSPVWSPHGDELLYEDYIPLQLPHIKLNLAQVYKIALGSHEPQRLTNNGANFDPDWFDPTVLSVAPQPQLFTTVWAKIKRQN